MRNVLLAILLAAVMTAAYGFAASMTIATHQLLGGGDADVSIPVNVSNITWSLDITNPAYVKSIEIEFKEKLAGSIPAGSKFSGTLIVTLYDDGGGTVIETESTQVSWAANNDATQETFTVSVDIDDQLAENIDKIATTLVGSITTS